MGKLVILGGTTSGTVNAKLNSLISTLSTVNSNVSTINTRTSNIYTSTGSSSDSASQTGTSLQAKTKYIANTIANMNTTLSTVNTNVSSIKDKVNYEGSIKAGTIRQVKICSISNISVSYGSGVYYCDNGTNTNNKVLDGLDFKITGLSFTDKSKVVVTSMNIALMEYNYNNFQFPTVNAISSDSITIRVWVPNNQYRNAKAFGYLTLVEFY